MWRVGITLKNQQLPIAKNFATKEECEEWVLQEAEKGNMTKSIVVNKENIKERFITSWD